MIFFDLDGTLHHQQLSEARAAAALRRATSTFHPMPEEQFVAAWAEITEHFFNRHLAGELTFAEQRRRPVQEMGKRCGVIIRESSSDEIFSRFLIAYEDKWCLYPEAQNCLAELTRRGVSMGLITNGDSRQQRSKLSKLGLADIFRVVIISSEHNVSKPERRIFQIAASLADVSAERCWYIGDRLDVDAEARRGAGFNAVSVNREGSSPEPPSGIEVVQDLEAEQLCRVLRLYNSPL